MTTNPEYPSMVYLNGVPQGLDVLPRPDFTNVPVPREDLRIPLANVVCVCGSRQNGTSVLYKRTPDEKSCGCMVLLLSQVFLATHDFKADDELLLMYPGESDHSPADQTPIRERIKCNNITLVTGDYRTLIPEKYEGINVIHWHDYFMACGNMFDGNCQDWYSVRTETPTKLFTCYNNRGRPHRDILMEVFIEMGVITPQGNRLVSDTAIYSNISQGYTLDEIQNNQTRPWSTLSPYHMGIGPYNDGLIDVVTETEGEFSIRFTEKTLKPILRMKPFLIMGAPGTNQALTELGYKQYPIFDYSFDAIEDMTERAKALAAQVVQYSNDDIQWIEEQCRDIALYNRELAFELGLKAKDLPAGIPPEDWQANIYRQSHDGFEDYIHTRDRAYLRSGDWMDDR
jgi:hypothetical protein